MSMAWITKDSETQDLRLQQILSSPRPLFLFAFQRHVMQLHIMLDYRFRSSLPPATAKQASRIDLHVRPAFRTSVILCSRLSVTVAVRLLSFRGLSAVKHPFNACACILSRLHHLPGRLGAVASSGAGIVRELNVPLNPVLNCYQSHYSCLAFDSFNNLVLCKRWGIPFEVICYHDGSLLRGLEASRKRSSGDLSGMALDGAGHVIMCAQDRVDVLRYSDASCMRTITQPFSPFFGPECDPSSFPLPEYVSSGDEEDIPSDDDDTPSEIHFTGEVDPVCHLQFKPRSVAVDSDGNIAVYDTGNGVVKVFRLSDGALLRTIGGRSSGYRALSQSDQCGIAFDMEGNLVVTDLFYKKGNQLLVLRYSDGAVIRTIKLPNVHPVGITFDGAGHVVVVDCRHFVHVLRYSDGQFVRTIPIEAHCYMLGGVAIDRCGRIVLAVDGRVVVVE
jgi:hypothetical protein